MTVLLTLHCACAEDSAFSACSPATAYVRTHFDIIINCIPQSGHLIQFLLKMTSLPVCNDVVLPLLFTDHFQLDDSVQMGMLAPAAGPEVSLRLEGRGLRGGGKIQTTASCQRSQLDF